MAIESYTLNWDNLNTSTDLNYDLAKMVVDNFGNNQPFLKKLLAQKKTFNGGTKVTSSVVYDESQATRYSGLDTLSIEDPEIFTHAVWNIGQYAVPITMSKQEFDMNNGTPKIFDLMSEKHQDAQRALEREIALDVRNSSAGALSESGHTFTFTGDANQLQGYGDIIAEAPSTDPANGNVGGISRSGTAGEYWRNQFDDPSMTTATLTLAPFREMYNLCSDGLDTPDCIVTTDPIYSNLERLAVADNNFIVGEVGDIQPAKALHYKNAAIFPEKDAIAEAIYFINTKYLQLHTDVNNNFKVTPWIQPVNQLAMVKWLTVSCALVCTQPRRQGVIFNINTA